MTTPTLTTPTNSNTEAVELDGPQLALVTLQADPGHYQWLTTKAVRQREAATILLANADLAAADDEQLQSQLALIRRRHEFADRRVQRAAEADPTSVMRDVHLQTSADLMRSVLRSLHKLLGHTGSLPESMRTS